MEQVRTNRSDMSITDSIMQLDQIVSLLTLDLSLKGANCQEQKITHEEKIKIIETYIVNPEKPDVPLNKNDAFQKVQKRHVQEKR